MSVNAPVSTGYAPVAKLLHWLVFVLLAIQYVVAWTMPHIGRNTKPETLINLHFTLGVLIVLVVLVRLMRRLVHAEPAPLDDVPQWQETSARLLHWVLYALLVVSPVLGWV